MKTGSPRRAMVLAAGLGVRMRPITLTIPKPLIPIGERTMLDRAIDALSAYSVEHVVINAHYLAGAIERHIAARRLGAGVSPPMTVVIESERLETGGGVFNALPLLGSDAPFFVVNGDILWCDGPRPTLEELACAWDGDRMDALLLLQPLASAIGYDGPGDFALTEESRLVRRPTDGGAPFLFAGVQILHPRLFRSSLTGAFSLNVVYNQAIAAGRAYGLVHRGGWCHVGTPADIPLAEAFLRAPPLCSAAW